MALPALGQPISFEDLEIEQGFISGHPPIPMGTQAVVYGVGFAMDGSNPLGMDEFAGLSAPRYDLYDGIVGPGYTIYAVPWANENPAEALFGDSCLAKQTAPPGLRLGDIATSYPAAQFGYIVGAACGASGGGGGGDPFSP
jgi:hypothetical protein